MKYQTRCAQLVVKSLPFAVALAVVTGCAGLHAAPNDTVPAMTLCDIGAQGGALLGVRVRTSGTYESDSGTYGFIVDEACGSKRNSIDIGRAWGVPEYDRLRADWTRGCEARGEHLCVVSQDVTVVGVIRKSDEGEYLVIDLEQIQAR
jgi:hypothetical protein